MVGFDKRSNDGQRVTVVAGLSLLMVFVVPSCSRNVAEEDCRSLGVHLRAIWMAEAKFPPSASTSAEKATALIKSEGIKLEESVFASCKRDFMGKPKASGEFSCLSRANTYADVQACATMPVQ